MTCYEKDAGGECPTGTVDCGEVAAVNTTHNLCALCDLNTTGPCMHPGLETSGVTEGNYCLGVLANGLCPVGTVHCAAVNSTIYNVTAMIASFQKLEAVKINLADESLSTVCTDHCIGTSGPCQFPDKKDHSCFMKDADGNCPPDTVDCPDATSVDETFSCTGCAYETSGPCKFPDSPLNGGNASIVPKGNICVGVVPQTGLCPTGSKYCGATDNIFDFDYAPVPPYFDYAPAPAPGSYF
jgi:hypothetical protein